MDLCRDLSVSGVFPTEYMPESGNSSLSGSSASLDDLFLHQNAEGDMNLEWLSIFVEDCLSSSTDYLSNPLQNSHTKPSENNKKLEVIIPSKVRSKRKRSRNALNNNKSHAEFTQKPFSYMDFSDTLLLNQTQWLAESELVVFKKESRREREEEETVRCPETVGNVGQIRRCAHCLSHRTPQWRAGPLGPKTLCNACGVRYKSGRLLPEYRPAKSPTFVSYKHSNSHKKVMEMRMSIVSPVQTD